MENEKSNDVISFIKNSEDRKLIDALDVDKKTLVIGVKDKAVVSEKLDDVIELVRKSKLLDAEVSRKIRMLNDMIV